MEKIKAKLKKVIALADELAAGYEKYYDEMPTSWQRSRDGQQFQESTKRIKDITKDLNQLT